MSTKSITKIAILLLGLCILSSAQNSTKLIRFVWSWNGDTLGIIDIPKGSQIKNTEYGEGLITKISYKDGSSITLHFGGVVKLPFCQLPECIVADSTKTSDYISRSGYSKDKILMWCEINYSSPFNIYYSDVRKSKKVLFDQALSSFVIKKSLKRT
jgi:hypothetical protein